MACRMVIYKILFQGLLLICTIIATPVYAACAIVGANNQNFGLINTNDNVSNYYLADVTVSCDEAYLLGIDAGFHAAGSRQLEQSGQFIPYSLFQEATGIEWGSQGLLAANPYPMQPVAGGSGLNVTHKIYASAITKDKAPQGIYSDTVNVTLADSSGNPIGMPTTLAFNLNLAASCTLDTTGFGSFGTHPVGNENLTNVDLGSIAVTCPVSIAYKVGIDKGQNPLAGGKRQMSLNGTQFIPYSIKYNAVEWGDAGLHDLVPGYMETFSTAPAITGIGAGTPQNFMISGDAWIENAKLAGTYTDTLIVTLAW
jgi:spore coat protein U-like protein